MGTTRMAGDVADGTVDLNCRLHGVENLYVAGSSVFPTGGCANPTFMIVTLAHRLVDHLTES
jgi:choline dehydrogenase-like flavoprotein